MIREVVRNFHCDSRNAPCNIWIARKGSASPEQELSAQYELLGETPAPHTPLGNRSLSPVEREARKLATAIVIRLLAKSGRKRKDVSKEAFEAEVERIAASDQVIRAASDNLPRS